MIDKVLSRLRSSVNKNDIDTLFRISRSRNQDGGPIRDNQMV
ncbi:MAG: hypothetical protein ACR5K4_02755 [Sodalis sp. (in: enterobacteria)]